jgi:hypothetical protein
METNTSINKYDKILASKYVEHIKVLHRAAGILHDDAADASPEKLQEAICHYERIIELLLGIDS